MTSGRCPLCRTSGDIWLFLQAEQDHAAAREWAAAVATLPAAVLPHVGGYIALFHPPAKELARTKETRLLIALQRAIAAGEITRNGITWTAPLAYWEYALRHLVDNPPAELPLRNHNYLFQVVANIAAKAAAQNERRQEEQRKHRPYQSTPPGAAQSADTANSSPPLQGGVARSAEAVSFGPPVGWLKETIGKILDAGSALNTSPNETSHVER